GPSPPKRGQGENGDLHEENRTMADRYMWLVWVGLAGLAWGTYVPLIAYGGGGLVGKPGSLGPRVLGVLLVGQAFLVLGVLVPLVPVPERAGGVADPDRYGHVLHQPGRGGGGDWRHLRGLRHQVGHRVGPEVRPRPHQLPAVHRPAYLRPGPGDQHPGERHL